MIWNEWHLISSIHQLFAVEVGENEPAVMSFDMTTGVPAIEGLLVGDERIKDAYPQKVRYRVIHAILRVFLKHNNYSQ